MRTRSTGQRPVERMLVGLDVAASLVDVQFDVEVAVVLQREQVVRRVDDPHAALATRCRRRSRRRPWTWRCGATASSTSSASDQRERLEVADDLVHVLDDAGDRLVLVHARRRCGSAHTAEPRSDESSMRRIALPSVCPKPRSSGCRRNSATFGLSSRFVDSTSCGRTSPRRSIVFAMCRDFLVWSGRDAPGYRPAPPLTRGRLESGVRVPTLT